MILIAIGLAVLAGGLRFYRLGAFPFAGDELATLAETHSFFTPPDGAASSQIDRLPRMIPLAYLVHGLDYRLFGTDEFGSRVLPAALGALGVAVVYLGLAGTAGEAAALVTALLLAVWPEHLLQSQENRFYMTAWLVASAAVMLGARAARDRSVPWAVAACLAGLVGVLCHTLMLVLLPGLFAAFAVSAWRDREPLPRRMLAAAAGAGVAAGAVVLGLVLTVGRGWNAGASWGYSPLHGLVAAVNRVGWPVIVLAGLGAVLALVRRVPGSGYWLTWVGVWLGASAVLPMVMIYHPGYTFPLTLAVFVLAGSAAAAVVDLLRPLDWRLAPAWVGVVLLLPLPSVASYYLDGSRLDYRTSARYVAEHWRPGDRVAAVSAGLFDHYARLPERAIAVDPDKVSSLRKPAEAPGRLWIVFPSGRGGKPEAVQEWLGRNCSQELVVRKTRLDYLDFAVEVFLYRPAPDPAVASR
jgi:hypothetical protein